MKTHRRFRRALPVVFLCACLLLAAPAGGLAAEGVRKAPAGGASTGRGYVGAQIADVQPSTVKSLGLASQSGAQILNIVKDGPAEQAGLSVDDVVIRWGGQEVPNAETLHRLVLATPVGKEVEVVFIRKKKEQSVQLTMSKQREGAAPGAEGGATQAQVEAEFLRALDRTDRKEMTPEEAFGDPKRWVVTIGGQRIFLDPRSRQWHYYDRIHETWEPTGFGIGEADFALVGGKLAAKRRAGR